MRFLVADRSYFRYRLLDRTKRTRRPGNLNILAGCGVTDQGETKFGTQELEFDEKGKEEMSTPLEQINNRPIFVIISLHSQGTHPR